MTKVALTMELALVTEQTLAAMTLVLSMTTPPTTAPTLVMAAVPVMATPLVMALGQAMARIPPSLLSLPPTLHLSILAMALVASLQTHLAASQAVLAQAHKQLALDHQEVLLSFHLSTHLEILASNSVTAFPFPLKAALKLQLESLLGSPMPPELLVMDQCPPLGSPSQVRMDCQLSSTVEAVFLYSPSQAWMGF